MVACSSFGTNNGKPERRLPENPCIKIYLWILVHILLPALCLLRPTNNAFKQSAVQVDNRDTGSVTYSVQVNTANWEWSIFHRTSISLSTGIDDYAFE